MNKILVLATAAFLFSCSDTGNVIVDNSNLNESIPSESTLAANYNATISNAEIKSDLEQMKNSVDFSAISSALSSQPNALSSTNPSTSELNKVAAVTCKSLDYDTTFVISEDTISIKSQSKQNGKPYELCVDPSNTDFTTYMSEVIQGLDGVTTEIKQIAYNKYRKAESEYTWKTTIPDDYETQGTFYDEMSGYSFITNYSPEYLIFAELYMKMTLNMSTKANLYMKMLLHLNNGRYQCLYETSTLDQAEIEENAIIDVCDITHAGEKVGKMQTNGKGEIIILDLEGNTFN